MLYPFQRYFKKIILMFDISDRLTFQKLDTWVADLKTWCRKDAIVTLVGSKSDLPPSSISEAEIEKLKDVCSATYFQTSSKTGQNAQEVFAHIINACINKLKPST